MDGTLHFAVRKTVQNRQAILFIHGFHGDAHLTFGLFPAFLAGDPRLYGWDLFCIGYPTSLAPDITGVWTADPDLTSLAGYLDTLDDLYFGPYERLVLIAHSMGGLIVQRALANGKLTPRVVQGEAFLYRRHPELALAKYQEALDLGPNPREIESMQRQAIWITRLLDDPQTEARLDKLFLSPGSSAAMPAVRYS